VVATGAAVAGAAVAGAAVAGAAVAGAAVAGAVVGVAPQALKTMVAAITRATITYSCFFIFLLLIKEKLAG
jgi:hypothetical protein